MACLEAGLTVTTEPDEALRDSHQGLATPSRITPWHFVAVWEIAPHGQS